MKRKVLIITLVSLFMCVGASGGAYYLGHKYGVKQGFEDGFSVGNGIAIGKAKEISDLERELSNQREENDDLRISSQQAVRPTVNLTYPTHCSSMTYGINNNFQSTNCY